MVMQLDDTVLAYANASYAEAAADAASHDPQALHRMVDKIKALHQRYGKKMLRHTAVLSLVAAAVWAIDRALEYPRVARKLALTTGKLESVTKMAALGFALYKLVTSLLAAVTPEDEAMTPEMHRRLIDLDRKNDDLRRTVDDVNQRLREKVENERRDLGVQNVTELDRARVRRRAEQEDEEGEEEENFDGAYDGPPLPGPLRRFQKKRVHEEEPDADSAHASTEAVVTALSILRPHFPGAVTTQELYPSLQSVQIVDDVKFLRKIENLDASKRDAYARRLAGNPAQAQTFVDRVFSITRRLRKDAVGQKIHYLGSFVVKWATIFAVQSIMFKMLVYVTKAKAFDAIGGVTRFALACLCALNSILVLVHNAGPEDEDTPAVNNIRKTALRSKATINKLTAT